MTDRDEWLEWRRGGIGASDIAGILGISPWSSPWSVWADKRGLLPPEPETALQEAGHWLEPAIARWFENRTDLVVAGEQTQCTHRTTPWMRCTADGFVFESRGELILDHALGLLQIKTDWPGKRWDELPPHHQAQGQWEMAVTDMDRNWFAVLHGRVLEIYELKRDQADIDLMFDKAEQFWTDHVLTGTPPALDGHRATMQGLAALYPKATPKSSVPIDDVAGAVPMLVAAKAAKRTAEEDENAASAVLRWAMKDNYEGTIRGFRAVTLGSQTRKTTCQHCGKESESAPFRVLRPAKGFK